MGKPVGITLALTFTLLLQTDHLISAVDPEDCVEKVPVLVPFPAYPQPPATSSTDKCCLVVYPPRCDAGNCVVRRRRECGAGCPQDGAVVVLEGFRGAAPEALIPRDWARREHVDENVTVSNWMPRPVQPPPVQRPAQPQPRPQPQPQPQPQPPPQPPPQPLPQPQPPTYQYQPPPRWPQPAQQPLPYWDPNCDPLPQPAAYGAAFQPYQQQYRPDESWFYPTQNQPQELNYRQQQQPYDQTVFPYNDLSRYMIEEPYYYVFPEYGRKVKKEGKKAGKKTKKPRNDTSSNGENVGKKGANNSTETTTRKNWSLFG